MSELLNALKDATNYTRTENGALTHKTTKSNLLDMFAMGAAMRNRSEADVILMFKNAFEENAELAIKMLFYIRDVRGGQGERRFFRVILTWAANQPTMVNTIRKNIKYIPEFGRWDDLYSLCDTPLEAEMFAFMKEQFMLDLDCNTPSLLGKWMKSENASSKETKQLGEKTRQYMGLDHREYRKALSTLRKRINVLEVLMSANRWNEIEFDKIPSRAGIIYKNAFARRDMIAEKYRAFAKNSNTKVNAGTLYPYEVVEKAINLMRSSSRSVNYDDVDRLMINKYWDNLTDYFKDAKLNALCMIDTSGSMIGTPINVAISLGLYCAERNKGPWANHFITFSRNPHLVETHGIDFCDKVHRIVRRNECENTNIEAAFNMILNTCIKNHLKQEDLPEYMIVISDMEFDYATTYYHTNNHGVETLMEGIERKFNEYGYRMPKMIYWNVDARHPNIPVIGNDYVSYISGFSPSVFTSILTGKTGWELMIEAICAKRYDCIHA